MTLELPLIDGCFVFDNSSLEKLQNCPYEYYLSTWLRRTAGDSRAGLNFGSACHSVMKYRYMTRGSGPCLPEDVAPINAILEDHFAQSPEPPGDYRTLSLAQEWACAYNNVYKQEPFEILKLKDGKPFVERSFMRPFAVITERNTVTSWHCIDNVEASTKQCKANGFTPIFFAGRIDLGISDDHGDHWILDHKSTYQFGSNFTADMLSSPQCIGYAWEFKQYYGTTPQGYIINAFRPRKPVVGSDYDPSLLWRITGKDPDFLRIQKQITQADLNEWEQNTFNMLEEVLFHYSRGTFGKHKKNCVGKYGRCQYYELCNEVAPEFRESYLNGANFIDNTWSPLNPPQKKDLVNEKTPV